MKKRIVFLLCCIMAIGLIACNTQTFEDGTTSGEIEVPITTQENSSLGNDFSVEQSTETPTVAPAPVTGVTEIISSQYDEAWPFCEGFAVVGLDDGDGMKYNYIDTGGQLLLEEWVDVARSFSEGLACIGYATEISSDDNSRPVYRFGYIDASGEIVIPTEILSYKTDYPRAFYLGYAEIMYIDEDNKMCSNVIDREGQKLFDFPLSYGYVYGENDTFGRRKDRYFFLEQQSSEHKYCFANDWMKNYVNGLLEKVLLYDDESNMTYVVDYAGNLIKRIDGYVKRISEDYYINRKNFGDAVNFFDKDFNFLSETNYSSVSQTEHGLYIAELAGLGNYLYRYVLLNRYLTEITEPYGQISPTPDGHLVRVGSVKWKLRGPDGEEIFLFSELLDSCEYQEIACFADGRFQQNQQRIYLGHRKNGEWNTYLFSPNGEMIFSCAEKVAPLLWIAEDKLWLMNVEEHTQLIDQNGNICLDLPHGDMEVYGIEEHIFLRYDTPQMWGLYELVKVDDRWEAIDKESVSKEDLDLAIAGGRIILAENEESRIVYDGQEEGLVTLELADGTILEKDCSAVSLVSDGLYLVAWEVREMRDGRNPVYYQTEEVCLKYNGQTISEVYENMDVLSEDHIAFCEDGKWGYLKIERE